MWLFVGCVVFVRFIFRGLFFLVLDGNVRSLIELGLSRLSEWNSCWVGLERVGSVGVGG